jgi:hypothetical protein
VPRARLGQNQSALFGKTDEFARQNLAAGRVMPNGSSYEPGAFIGALTDLGSRDPDANVAAKSTQTDLGSTWSDVPPWSKATLGTTDAAGGWIIPNAIVDDVIKPAAYTNFYRDICTVVSGVTGANVDVPFRSSSPARATIAGFGDTKENVFRTRLFLTTGCLGGGARAVPSSDYRSAVQLPAQLYHLTSMPVSPGDGILPGRWGSTVRTWYRRHRRSHKFYRRELIFESIRRAEFPELPSRLNCVFLFADLGLAQAWRTRDTERTEHIFRVVALIGRTHVADIAWTSEAVNGVFDFAPADVVIRSARGYWSGRRYESTDDEDGHVEVLVGRGIVLGDRVV